MAEELEFKSLSEAAKVVGGLLNRVEALEQNAEKKEASAEEKAPEKLKVKVGRSTYEFPATISLATPGGKITAKEILESDDLAKKLVESGHKAFKKV